METPPDPQTRHERFDTTHWSVVLRAQSDAESAGCPSALATLCQTYWFPLYGYVRRKGYGKQDAEDLTQGFFCYWLEKRHFDRAKREQGKFRAFLITAFKHFIHTEWEKATAQKRGGDREILSLDLHSAETRFQSALLTENPNTGFDHDWATTLFSAALDKLEQEHSRSPKKFALFEHLRGYLWVDDAMDRTYAETAKTLDMTEAAVKMSVSRLRGRFRQLLREEVAHTLSDPEDIEDEFRYLLEVLNVGAESQR